MKTGDCDRGKGWLQGAVAARSGLRSQPVAAALASSAEQIQVVRAPGFSHEACHIASITLALVHKDFFIGPYRS